MKIRFLLWAVMMSFLCLNGCAVVTIPLLPPTEELTERVVDGEGKDKILLLDISGTISDARRRKMGFREDVSLVDEIKEALKKAEKDKNVKGLILRVNSPGGTVTASDIIHHEITRHKKTTGQRVSVCFLDVGASGAYYVATAADEIIAHPTTITGSIGVVAMKFNIQGLMAKIGVEQETIKSGDYKDIMSPFRPSTPEEQRIMQALIDHLQKRFVDVIVDGRKTLNRAAVEKLADGRVYTAAQALEARLIDRIGYLDQAIDGMKKSLGLEKAQVVVYHRPDAYKGTIYSGMASVPSQVNFISIDGRELLTPPGVQFMYLWTP